MKHLLIAPVMLALGSAPVLASASESTTTLYGVADLGWRTTSGLSAALAPSAGNATSLSSGVNSTSRLGYRGREDLGGGWFATLNLETGLNLDTGATANASKFFDRASVVGLGGGWGQVTLGRQTTLLADAISPVDSLGMRFAAFNPNIGIAALSSHGLGVEYGPSGASTGAYRLDNAIKYAGRIGPVTVRAMHALGEVSGAASAQSSTGWGAAYSGDAWAVSGATQRFKSTKGLELQAHTLGVAYQWGPVRLTTNWGRSEAETTATTRVQHRTQSLGATWAVAPLWDLTGAWYRVSRERTAQWDDGFRRLVLVAEYKLSRRTKLYAEWDQTQWQRGYQGTGNKDRSTGLTAGWVHQF